MDGKQEAAMKWPTEDGLYWIEAIKNGTTVKGAAFGVEFPRGLLTREQVVL